VARIKAQINGTISSKNIEKIATVKQSAIPPGYITPNPQRLRKNTIIKIKLST
jgi:hypothetical protein